MEDNDFFDDFCYKDLSGVKKFNFKKVKLSNIPESPYSPLRSGTGIDRIDYPEPNISKVSLNTSSFQAFCNSSSPKYPPQKNEEVTSRSSLSVSNVLPKMPTFSFNSDISLVNCTKEITDTGLRKTNISSNKGKMDTVLDSLYKNTVSNKNTTRSSKAQKPFQKLLLEKKAEGDFKLTSEAMKITEVSLNTRKSYNKSKDIKRCPSLLSENVEHISKKTCSISKYFNNKSKSDDFKSSELAPCLSPFKKIVETNNCTVIDVEVNKVDITLPIDMKTGSQPIVDSSKPPIIASNSNCTSTDSPICKPKQFNFKMRPLSLSSNFTSSHENNSFDCVFSEIKKESNQSINSSNNFNLKSDCVSKSNLCLTPNEGESRNSASTLEYNSTTYNKKNLNINKNTSELEPRLEHKASNSINVDNVTESFLLRQSLSSSQSLEITDNDYMNDEEFERRYGRLTEQFDEGVFNSNENKVSTRKISQDSEINIPQNLERPDTEELLKEISGINWNDNCFDDEPIQMGFKDRDDDSKEFKKNYDHSEVMLEMLHQKFGLRSFRPHQREVINASLKQHDCFVLMPTGGGKSLCYQLPAVLMPGVTVVVSPLRALISDQVDKLNALDIAAAHLCSDVSKVKCEQIYMKLSIREPTIKLLYLTPEKIVASRVIIDILESLYQRGKLARFVIDEVHCLSQWGHDFRPDYKQLSMLRKHYKDVPIICLTATATKQVEQDVINILGLKNVKRFIRSFNRPNIKYQVIPKSGKGTAEEIANLIKSQLPKKSGIVYCLSRQDCDKLAEKFNNLNIKSKPYHAGMGDKVREAIQREWMQDRFHVIVATIAFGMGIDKPDVRFVIHNSIPKSVEAFYQESGRAGRDGEVSYSYIYYSYMDVVRLQKLIQKDRSMSKHTLDAHNENLKQMVSFAENVVDCRRYLQLLHLGEHFDRSICISNKATICDNCENIDNYKSLDITKEAKELCAIVRDLTSSENVTMLYVADIYRGAKIKKILDRGHNKHPHYGAGAAMDKNDVQRVLKQLILKQILNDFCAYTGEFPVLYIKTGPKFYQFFNSDRKLHISVCTNKQQKKKETIKVDETNDKLDVSKPSTSGVVRHTLQKQTTAKLQAARKLQLSKLKMQCHEELLEECRRLAMERNLTLSSIMNLSAIKIMSDMLPNSREEMLKIQHVTNANFNKYGEFFLNITQKFRIKHDALLPFAVAPRSVDKNNFSEDDYQSDSCPSSSREKTSDCKNRGVKRKGGGWIKKSTFKKRKVFKKKGGKASPSKRAIKSVGLKGKGGKLGLMSLHIK